MLNLSVPEVEWLYTKHRFEGTAESACILKPALPGYFLYRFVGAL